MFNTSKIMIFFAIAFLTSLSFADNLTAQDLWLQSTATTRAAAEAMNNQVMNQQAQQQAIQTQQQQQVQQALDSIQLQQKATQNNQTISTPSTSFQAQPNTTTNTSTNTNTGTTTNPWLKPNPWQNTQQNPFGQKYVPPAGLNNSNTIYTPANNPTGTSTNTNAIYVNPSSQPSQQPQPNPNPVNIYK